MTSSVSDSSEIPENTLPALARLFDESGAAVFLFDDHDRLLYANNQYYDLICFSHGTYPTWSDIIRNNHAHGRGLIIEAEDVELWLEAALKKRRTQTYRQFEIDAWDGRWLLMTETLIPGLGLLGVGVDITREVNTASALNKEYQNALAIAETDLLTDMGNRRALERLRKLFTNKGRHRLVTGLMIDIDQFKDYNDTLGHLQGDQCLQQLAEVIRNSLRLSDAYPIRIGGDEFLILMLDAEPSVAEQVAQRIKDSVLRSAIPHPATSSGLVTLSIGIASSKIVDSESFSLLLKDADDALYKAKRSGRNRIDRL